MRRLYARIAFGIILAVAAGSVVVLLVVPRIVALFQEDLTPRNRLTAIAIQLEAVPQEQWPDELQRLQPGSKMSLRVVASTALAADVHPAMYLPLHGGTHFLVASPSGPPPITPVLLLGLVFVFVLTATASAIVGIPLVRRLQHLQQAIEELGGGNWAMRLDANAEGALSELAGSINHMAAQLHEQFQEREALLQTVSHELGTPLARMRFQIELIEAELQGRFDRRRLSALTMDLDELDDLSTELVSWMEPNARSEWKTIFRLAPIVESLVELEYAGKSSHVSVEVRIPDELLVTADRRQFQRVIENLLRNASRYAQNQVVVEGDVSDEGVTIEVRDDGPGISEENRLKVLEPFVRLDQPSARPHHRGVGLGLAIVRRIVKAHGGSITICRAAEGGTSVRTTWPRSEHS